MKALLLGVALAAGLATSVSAAGVEGDWIPASKGGKVRIAPCAGQADRLCGNLVAVTPPNDASGRPKRDMLNTDASLRGRPILGLPLLTGFKPNGPGKWNGGKIYNPEDGKTYSSKLTLRPDGTLKVEGCVSVICKAQIWTRPTSG